MRTLIIIVGLFSLFQIKTFSQNNTAEQVKVSGQVIDKDTNEAVEFASVRLLSPKDSTYIAGGVADVNGVFSISAVPGKYIFKASLLGFTDFYKDINLNKNIHIEDIFLTEDAAKLDEVIVEAKAIEIMVRGDTIEYNADSYKVQESAVVEDLLKKMPGVEIDSDGKIKVNGQEVKKILVDGKEFFSDDPKVASKNLPAKMVEKLQVLDRKSDMALMTGFDDGNEETVINLTIKPGMKEGLFGSALAGYGSEDRYEGNAMVNYMRNSTQMSLLGGVNNTNNAGMGDLASAMFGDSGGRGPRGMSFGGQNGVTKTTSTGFNFATEYSDKFKWGGDVRYGSNKNTVTSESNKLFTSERNSGSEVSNAFGINRNQSFATNLRLEWTPDKMTKIIFTPRVEYNTNDRYSEEKTVTDYEPGALLAGKNNTSDLRYISEGSGYKLNGSLEMSRQLNDKGRVVTLGLKGGYSKSESEGYDYNKIVYADVTQLDSIIDLSFHQEDKSTNWSIQTSYVEPLGRNNFLELSYNISNNNSITDRNSWSNSNLNNPLLDPIYNVVDTANTRYVRNDFINQNVSLKFRAQRLRENGHTYNYTVGMGLEPSSSQTDLLNPDKPREIIPRKHFLSFAPMGQFNYMWDKRQNIRIDYKGSTTEPTTLQLYDGIYSRNGLNTTSGNPNLKPSYQSRLDVRYRKFNPEKASFMALSGRFTHTSNAIVTIQNANVETGGRDASYANVNGNMNGNLRFMMNQPLKNRNWSINSMSSASYQISNTLIDLDKNKAKTLSLQQNAGIRFQKSDIKFLLLNDIDMQLKGNIRYEDQGNSINKKNNYHTFNYGGAFDLTLYLPYDFSIESDINYSTNSGYSGGYQQKEWLWNASIAKQIFKDKSGTIRIKMYDILKERSNISRTYSADYVMDTRTNTIPSYFMVHFVYRFQIFKGGAKIDDMDRKGSGRPPRM